MALDLVKPGHDTDSSVTTGQNLIPFPQHRFVRRAVDSFPDRYQVCCQNGAGFVSVT
jgi:hypothetical protein